MEIRDRSLVGEEIILDGKSATVHFILHSTLVDCRIRCSSKGRMLAISDTTFDGCVFDQRVALSDFDFTRSRFSNSKFKGKYVGVDFGSKHPSGGISECDFTDASLHLCRFYGDGSVASRFAGWPFVAIPFPGSGLRVVQGAVDVSGLEVLLGVLSRQSPECSCVVIDMRTVSREQSIDLEDLKAMFAPYVHEGECESKI